MCIDQPLLPIHVGAHPMHELDALHRVVHYQFDLNVGLARLVEREAVGDGEQRDDDGNNDDDDAPVLHPADVHRGQIWARFNSEARLSEVRHA